MSEGLVLLPTPAGGTVGRHDLMDPLLDRQRQRAAE